MGLLQNLLIYSSIQYPPVLPSTHKTTSCFPQRKFRPGRHHLQFKHSPMGSYFSPSWPREDGLLSHQRTISLLAVFFFFVFYFIKLFFLTLQIVLVFPNIKMNPPQVYMCSPSWTLLPPHTIPLGHPSALAPSIQYHASNLDWQLISYMIFYMFQCHSPKSSHPLPLQQSP